MGEISFGCGEGVFGSGLDSWGFDILYFGDIPNGAGLSSSASIEVVTALC